MKRKIIILIFAMAGFLFAGVQSANAQNNWDIKVNWTDNCGGCPTVGTYEYYVCCTITDICNNQQVVYNNCVIKSSGIYTHTFNVGEICDIDEHEKCFIVNVSVVKRCVIGQAEICNDSDHDTVNCSTIYDGEMEFSLFLEE